MKTITFFSEKGGVGKSTFAIMYASWLKYKHGVNVALADFNFRIDAYRADEISERKKLIKNNPEIKPFDIAAAWPIITAETKQINEIKDRYGREVNAYVEWFREKTYNYEGLKKYDIVICDFPGALTGGEYAGLAGAGFLNLTVMPVERDAMTLKATEKIHTALDKLAVNHCMFLTKARLELVNLRKPYMQLANDLLNKLRWPLLPDIVSYSERIRSLEKVENIRSTFGFPNFEASEWGNSKDLGIENLFIDITKELDKTADLPKTKDANLDFVYGLKKVDDGRNIHGTKFPEYEI